MKLFPFLLVCCCCFLSVSCKLNVSDKCPILVPFKDNFAVDDLFHKWYVLKLVMHYFGREPPVEYNSYVSNFTLEINSGDDVTKKRHKAKHKSSFESVQIHWSSNTTSRTYLLKIYEENEAVWKENSMNVQVLFVYGNYSILTFCDWDLLFSLILTINPPPYSEDDNQFANDVFEHVSLNVESIKDFSLGNMINTNDILAGLCIFIIVRLYL